MASSGKIVLNYGDSLVRESEMDILKGNTWLNDIIIEFYFEYLRTEVHKEESLDNRVKFFGPSITHLIKLSLVAEEEVLFGVKNASSYNFMFWPVNNAEDPNQQSGGSHWSLLVYSRPENVFAHFDSSHGANNKNAIALHQKLIKILPKAQLQHRECICQANSFDCGLHVLCNANIIAEHALETGGIQGVHTATPEAATAMRLKLKELIELLAITS